MATHTDHRLNGSGVPRVGRPRKTTNKGIGRRLEEVREEKKLTQEQLTAMLRTWLKSKLGIPPKLRKVSRHSISSIESGKIKNPGSVVAGAIASVLGVNPLWLIFGDEPKWVEAV